MSNLADAINAQVAKVAAAQAVLQGLIAAACPGTHAPVQHRDRKPPWCTACGYTAQGEQILATSPGSPVGTNAGHGHAWERPDGMKARCGGPGMCSQCRSDEMMVTMRSIR